MDYLKMHLALTMIHVVSGAKIRTHYHMETALFP